MTETGTLWECRIDRGEDLEPRPGPVIYWMQRSQRSRSNPALTLAIERANRQRVPVLCYVALNPSYPGAALRHVQFFLEGLQDVALGLEQRGVGLVIRREHPAHGLVRFAREVEAGLVITDESHLGYGSRLRGRAAAILRREEIPLWRVDNDVVVPVTALGRAHYAARTIRPHLHRAWDQHLGEIPEPEATVAPPRLTSTVGLLDLEQTLSSLQVDRSVTPVPFLRSGEGEARRRLDEFVQRKLARYDGDRNNAAVEGTSGLSPYLHFGQIDPWTVARAVRSASAPAAAKNALLEELLVRRELAFNFAHYTPGYDCLDGLPSWARKTLEVHAGDLRPAVIPRDDLERGRSGDDLWDAAQGELLLTGSIQGWVRMYWGKRVIEWSRNPGRALATLTYLNNRYALDGRDPVSYANVAWCFGLHDRPWPPRPIFGTVRSMSRAGAARRFDVDAYLERIAGLRETAPSR